MADDLTRLRAQHPGWQIGSVWTAVASGPDARCLWASRNGVQVHARSAAELSARIREEERQSGNEEADP